MYEIELLSLAEARQLYESLPTHQRVPTLDPAYVAADAARDLALNPLFMVWRNAEGFLLHCVQETKIPESDAMDWQSAYGYGGPLVHALGADDLHQAWVAVERLAAKRKILVEFIRFHPVTGNQEFYPGTVRVARTVVKVDLTAHDLLSSYEGRARTAIRKAIAEHLHTQWESQGDAQRLFPDFYRAGMRQIGAADFYLFSDSYFQRLLSLPSARVLSIMSDSERVAMGLFLFGRRVVEYHLSATTQSGRKSGATNLLLHTAATTAQEMGSEILYLGGGTTNSADDPLLRFKSSFSKPGLNFAFGYRIFNRRTYDSLREQYNARGSDTNRILFYR